MHNRYMMSIVCVSHIIVIVIIIMIIIIITCQIIYIMSSSICINSIYIYKYQAFLHLSQFHVFTQKQSGTKS